MIVKINLLICKYRIHNVNANGKVVAINLKLFLFLFSVKIVQVKFMMKL